LLGYKYLQCTKGLNSLTTCRQVVRFKLYKGLKIGFVNKMKDYLIINNQKKAKLNPPEWRDF